MIFSSIPTDYNISYPLMIFCFVTNRDLYHCSFLPDSKHFVNASMFIRVIFCSDRVGSRRKSTCPVTKLNPFEVWISSDSSILMIVGISIFDCPVMIDILNGPMWILLSFIQLIFWIALFFDWFLSIIHQF